MISTDHFTLILSPTISSFSPASAAVGATVTISGTNLSTTTAVTFGGIPAVILSKTPSTVKVTVPVAAITGKLVVTNPAATITSQGTFTVALPPTLGSFSPTSGLVGTTVTMTGSGFTGATAVTFAGILTTFMVDSDTQIRALVPVSAVNGTIKVTAPGGNVVSATRFTVTLY